MNRRRHRHSDEFPSYHNRGSWERVCLWITAVIALILLLAVAYAYLL